MDLKKSHSSTYMEAFKLNNSRTFTKSRFNFLNAHKGLRPGCLHGILGPMGCGKSTLAKAIIEDSSVDRNVATLLSEETIAEYQMKIGEEFSGNFSWIEEKDLPPEDIFDFHSYYAKLRETVVNNGIDVLVVDNVTTGFMYADEHGPKGQAVSSKLLHKLAKETNLAILYLAHTKKNYDLNAKVIMVNEDIRGSARLPIISEYMYLFHKITVRNKIYAILKSSKNRLHENATGYYLLDYRFGSYRGDRKLPFSEFKKIFKDADRL